MKKILMFATYTIAKPEHGGQKRVKALYEAYAKDTNIDVKFCAIYYPPHYKDHWVDDIAVPRANNSLMMKNPLSGDVVTGKISWEDKVLRKKITKLLITFSPDIIHFEQPFLYIGIKKILESINYKGKIIFGSQNIEFPMKQEMLENENFDESDIKSIVKDIKNIELDLVRNADLTLTVSDDDIESYIKLGAVRNKLVLARNGIDKQVVDQATVVYWNNFFGQKGITKIALFVGSAHPPNWTGLYKMIGSKVGFLKKDERIILAGSIGEYFEKHYRFPTETDKVVFWKRVISVGRLSEEKLTGLINKADCLLLPIVEGGGSNLKTAEALLSEKPIIGTNHAFRAFESFIDYPTVNISDKPEAYRKLIAESIRTKKPALTGEQSDRLKSVTWNVCLRDAIERVKNI